MSQPPEYPGNPADPQGGNPQGYPPQPRHSAPPPPPPGYGTPPPSPPGYGAPPPPPEYGQQGPGGYQAPGYGTPPPPPPPPPGYGAPQGGSPQGGYPAPAGPSGGPAAAFSVGDAFSWAWGKFTKNAVAMAVPAAIFAIGIGICIGVLYGSMFATSLNSGGTYTVDPDTGRTTYEAADAGFGIGAFVVMGVVYLVIAAIGVYMQACFASGSLDVADGKPVTIGTFLKPRNFGGALLTSLLVIVGVSIGSALCYIPGLIFAFLTVFAIQFAVDKSLSPIEAIKASIATARANVGPVLMSWLVQAAVLVAGELACGLGLIVALPIAFLIQVYTYRKLTGGSVAPLEQAGAPGQYPQGPQPGQYPPPQQYS